MRLNFRQGLASSELDANGHPNYLTINSSGISFRTTNRPLVFTVASDVKNYTISYYRDVLAWSTIQFVDVAHAWLYIDINRTSSVRSYGITKLLPFYGPTAPAAPLDDQHWFDTTKIVMKVYSAATGSWVSTIRVFAGEWTPTSLVCSSFGSQVGITTSSASGIIMADGFGKPIKDSRGNFVTTEDQLIIDGAPSYAAKLESNVTIAEAAHPIPAFHVVRYSGQSIVSLATYDDIGSHVIGVAVTNAVNGQPVDIVLSGKVYNPMWNWDGPNYTLWVGQNGELVDLDPFDLDEQLTRRPPVARTIDSQTILFDQHMGSLTGGGEGVPGPQGPQGIQGEPGADGANGIDGEPGPQGIQGIQGEPGTNGVNGVDGVDGTNGTNGTDGAQGIQGIQGIPGPQGPQGEPGVDGIDGIDGVDGVDGADGVGGGPDYVARAGATRFVVSGVASDPVTAAQVGSSRTVAQLAPWGIFDNTNAAIPGLVSGVNKISAYVEVKIDTMSSSVWYPIDIKDWDSGNNLGHFRIFADGSVGISRNTSWSNIATSAPGVVTAGSFHKIAISGDYSVGGALLVAVNGIVVITSTYLQVASIGAANKIQITLNQNELMDQTTQWSRFAIWSDALDATKLAALTTSGNPGSFELTTLRAYWPIADGSGITLAANVGGVNLSESYEGGAYLTWPNVSFQTPAPLHTVVRISAAPTGSFVGHANSFALLEEGGWTFIPPANGWICFDQATTLSHEWNGINWVTPVEYMRSPMTTTGDLIYSGDVVGTPTKLAVGSTGQFLSVTTAGVPVWKNGGDRMGIAASLKQDDDYLLSELDGDIAGAPLLSTTASTFMVGIVDSEFSAGGISIGITAWENAKSVDVGIYEFLGGGKPGACIASATYDTSTGAGYYRSFFVPSISPVPIVFKPGVYFIMVHANSLNIQIASSNGGLRTAAKVPLLIRNGMGIMFGGIYGNQGKAAAISLPDTSLPGGAYTKGMNLTGFTIAAGPGYTPSTNAPIIGLVVA